MKRFLAILLAVVLVLGVSACGKKEEAMAGGWTKEETELSENELAIFNKAVAGTEYETYEPISLMGTQVVAGMNYKFKCKDTDGNEKILTVYCDLQQNCSVTGVE